MFTAIIATVFAAFLGSIGWLFKRVDNQLESHETRITILETRQDPLQEYIKTRFDSVESRLDRIEHKQDKES